MSPPLDVRDVEQLFGNIDGFPATSELLKMVAEGVPDENVHLEPSLTKYLAYGNHRRIRDHLPQL